MKILIITTFYPPDTAIAAIRPYMIAKYLSKFGNDVTVIRSGLIDKSFGSNLPELDNVRVLSFLGDNSPAEKYKQGIDVGKLINHKQRLAFMPKKIKKVLGRIYHFVMRPIEYANKQKTIQTRFEMLRKVIDNLSKSESFDIVFSTYSELENAYAGEYAKEVFSCKWIMDFRDPIAQGAMQPFWEYLLCKKKQERIIDSCDLCTRVSNGILKQSLIGKRKEKTITVYNGYDDDLPCNPISANQDYKSGGKLVFCYTGQIYGHRMTAITALVDAICTLISEGRINIDNIELKYAGDGAEDINELLSKRGLMQMFTDYGYLSKVEVEELQRCSDIFLVLSWNTQAEQGVLTGKFFEGIKARKPILSLIAGDTPDSELFLINEEYQYGFCYELCRKEKQYSDLCNYIEMMYKAKVGVGKIEYNPSVDLFEAFRYSCLVEKLQNECLKLIGEKG